MELLGDVGLVEAPFSVSLEIVLISAQYRCMLSDERTIGSESFLVHLMELLDNMGQMEAHFGLFRDSANLDTR
jgi:hypothetical protein